MISLVAWINLLMGGYLFIDAILRLSGGMSLLIFDEYLYGYAKFIPLLLSLSMILASIFMLIRKSSVTLLYAYINSFLFLLFYTPSVFYSGIKERYSPWLLVIQFLLCILCTILLYTSQEMGRGRIDLKKFRYGEYSETMAKFEDGPKDKKLQKKEKPEA